MRRVKEALWKLLSSSNTQHELDKVLASDEFSDGVLDLETSVHLQEVEVLVAVTEHLHCASRAIAHSLAEFDRLLLHLTTSVWVDETGGGLLHDLLIASLN
jgi:hypothetical protein